MQTTNGENGLMLGPDGDLTSSMVSTAVVPRICSLIRNGILDIYSTKGMRCLVDLAEQIEASATADKFEAWFFSDIWLQFHKLIGQ